MKEVAKFFAGLTAWEAIIHLTFALSGVLPMTLLGVVITPSLNLIQIIVPGLVSIALFYYGWFYRS